MVEFNFTADTYDVTLQTVNPSNPSLVTGTIGTAPGIAFGTSSSAAQANSSTVLRLRAQNGGSGVAGARMLWDNMLIESQIPEPATLALFAMGAAAFAMRRARRR